MGFSEAHIRKHLSTANYDSFLRKEYPKEGQEYWDPQTGSCGFHARFVYESLGVKEVKEFEEVKTKDIDKILDDLDKGFVLTLLHNYPTDARFFDMPKDNRYGNHIFTLVKGGAKYFMTQAYLHRYKHSLKAFSRESVKAMLADLLLHHSDPDNTKLWKDIDLSLHKKYFLTDLRIWPDLPVLPHRKVHGITLFVEKAR